MKYTRIVFLIFLLIFVFHQSALWAQDFPDTIESVLDISADEWRTAMFCTHDLTKNGKSDVTILYEYDGPGTGVAADPTGRRKLLLIYLVDENGVKRKLVENQAFFPEEYFEDMSCVDGTIRLDFVDEPSIGSWTMTNHKYYFEPQENKLVLVRYEEIQTARNTGELLHYMIDFKDAQLTVTREQFDEDKEPEIIEQRGFPFEELRSIEELGKPFQWDFLGLKI